MTKGPEPSSGARGNPARRWFRIGPGLLLAIIASVFLWRQLPPGPVAAPQAPRIERTRVDQAPEAPPPGVPDGEWLLAQKDALHLSAEQRQKLIKLVARWRRDTAELRDALARTSDQFNREMASDKGKGVTIDSLREKASPVSALSRELAAARRAWWNEAKHVLTAAQQQQAEAGWQARFSPEARRK